MPAYASSGLVLSASRRGGRALMHTWAGTTGALAGKRTCGRYIPGDGTCSVPSTMKVSARPSNRARRWYHPCARWARDLSSVEMAID